MGSETGAILKKIPVAMVYDFDGTLSPRPMQEDSLFPELDIDPGEFWSMVSEKAKTEGSDPMLSYLQELMLIIREKKFSLDEDSLKPLVRRIVLFRGVKTWFERVNVYFPELEIRHYIVTSGMKELLKAHPLAVHWRKIYASEYALDHEDMPCFLKQLVTDTTKTQFLFRINKGRELLHESVNEHMDQKTRPIPFRNMIYFGDGLTDVPSMAVVRQNGGHAVAVYGSGDAGARKTAEELVDVGRANVCLEADYSKGGAIEEWVKSVLMAKLFK
jgi:hypothetical protein